MNTYQIDLTVDLCVRYIYARYIYDDRGLNAGAGTHDFVIINDQFASYE